MIHFVVNRSSGRGRGGKFAERISRYMQSREVPFCMHFTHARGDGEAIARQITAEDGGAHLVAVGGDGTFHEVLNGLTDPHESTLSFLPAGRGNDFARAARLERNVPAALEKILRGETSYIDYIAVGGRRCLNVAGTGLDIDVLEGVANEKGKLRYVVSLVRCLRRFTPYDIRVRIGDETKRFSAIMAGVCNGVAFGGGIRLNPVGVIDDGLLDVIVMEMPADGKIFSVLPKFVKGKHMALPITHHYRCDAVTVLPQSGCPVELDGEIYRDCEFACRVVAGGLKTCL